jgi:MraZ protein
MRFQGVYYNSIDPKGRASIPAKFRELLKGSGEDKELVVTQEHGGIVAYPVSGWNAFLDKFDNLPDDIFREDLYFTTPQSLREHCQLDEDGMRDVVVVGGGRKIQIWNKTRYLEKLAEASQRQADARQKRIDLGL